MRRFPVIRFLLSLKPLVSLKSMMAFVLMLLSIEGVARLVPFLVGRYVHQPFLFSVHECTADFVNKGKHLTWITNECGARGVLYHGQRFEIAVFGTSTSAGTSLDQKEAWPERLKKYLGATRVHVDNFSRDGGGADEAEVILKHLSKAKKCYHIALLMFNFHPKPKEERSIDAFHYSNQWAPSSSIIKFPNLLKRRVIKQIWSEPRLKELYIMYRKFVKPPQLVASSGFHPKALAMSNRTLRNHGKVNLIDMPVEFNEEQIKSYKNRVKSLLQLARNVSDLVYLITQPVAYDEMEHPGVSARWYTLYPIKGRKGYYLSNKTIAQSLRERNSFALDAANSLGVGVIDLDEYMRQMLRNRDDLFEDKWHFAPVGARVAADYIARRIKHHFSRQFLSMRLPTIDSFPLQKDNAVPVLMALENVPTRSKVHSILSAKKTKQAPGNCT